MARPDEGKLRSKSLGELATFLFSTIQYWSGLLLSQRMSAAGFVSVFGKVKQCRCWSDLCDGRTSIRRLHQPIFILSKMVMCKRAQLSLIKSYCPVFPLPHSST